MSSGVLKLTSPAVADLYQRIKNNNPKSRHYTIKNKYLVGVIHKGAMHILIYDLERSVKPLMRVVNSGDSVLLREFWSMEEGIKVLQDLERVTAAHKHKGEGK